MPEAVDMVVVYRASRESVSEVIGVLRREGFSPVTLENPSPMVIYASGYKYLVGIAVPRDEVRGAASVLRRWDEARRPEVEKLSRGLASQFFGSISFVVVLGLVLWFFGAPAQVAPLLFLVWLVIFAVAVNFQPIKEKLRARGGEKDLDKGRGGPL